MRTPYALLAVATALLFAVPAVTAAAPAATQPGDHIAMNASGVLLVKGPAIFVSSGRCVDVSCSSTQANFLPGFYADGTWTVLATVTSSGSANFSWAIGGWSDSTGNLPCLTPGEIVLTIDRATQTWDYDCPPTP